MEPKSRVVKGVPETNLGRLDGWLKIGVPWCTPLTQTIAGNDPELLRYITSRNSQHRFALVAFSCTFNPQGDAEFVKAWVEVQLSRDDGSSGPQPVAYSMQPLKGDTPQQLSRTVKIGSDLKILQQGAEVQLTQNVENLFIEALYEGQSNPAWELSRTPAASIKGVQRFSMVVQQPNQAPSSGSVTISASVEKKRFGVFTYKAVSPDPAKLAFRLP
jgi:hypothetical protein